MTTRRRFLSQALSLAASPLMPVSAGQVIAAATASTLPAATAAVLSPIHVDTVAEIAVSAFDLNCVYELNPFPLFGDLEELRESGFAELEPYFTHARFDTLYPMVDALKDLPEDRRGYGLDCLAYNIMQIFALRLTQINHLLMYPEAYLQALRTAPGFKDIIDAYHDEEDTLWELKVLGAQELRRDLLVAELEVVLDCAIHLAEKIVKLREPEFGVPVTAASYMAALIEWDIETEFSMPERGDDISSAEFARCLKIWMEKKFAQTSQFRLGLYDVPDEVLAELQGIEGSLVTPGNRLAEITNSVVAEHLFGSLAAKEVHFSRRAVDASLCRLVERLAKTSPGQQARISWDDIDDPASAHFNIRIAGAGAQIAHDVLGRLKEMFGEAEIKVTEFPVEDGAEGQVLEIGYMDSQGNAEMFRQALAEALREKEREYAHILPAEAAGSELEPQNPPILR